MTPVDSRSTFRSAKKHTVAASPAVVFWGVVTTLWIVGVTGIGCIHDGGRTRWTAFQIRTLRTTQQTLATWYRVSGIVKTANHIHVLLHSEDTKFLWKGTREIVVPDPQPLKLCQSTQFRWQTTRQTIVQHRQFFQL